MLKNIGRCFRINKASPSDFEDGNIRIEEKSDKNLKYGNQIIKMEIELVDQDKPRNP
jgi:hypothetical protein